MTDCPFCGAALPESGLVFDLERQVVFDGNKLIWLTFLEAAVFDLLYKNLGRQVTRRSLERLWGSLDVDAPQRVRHNIHRMRAKFESSPIMIETVRSKWHDSESGGYEMTISH